jgi:transposase-like protein
MQNILAVVPRGAQEMVTPIICTDFTQPDAEQIQELLAEVTTMLPGPHPSVTAMLTDAKADLLAFAAFTLSHWLRIWSSNPPERAGKEVTRPTSTVGRFPPTRRPFSALPGRS